MDLESSIPTHLRRERSCPRRAGAAEFAPPYPSFVARFDPALRQLGMAYLGLQSREPGAAADEALGTLRTWLAATDGPRHHDQAREVDAAGYTNLVTVAYWDDTRALERWFAAHGRHWTDGTVTARGCGTFAEVLRPQVERFETLFSAADRGEGAALLAERMSGMVQEHAYWGGMRDRIALAQTDALPARGAVRVESDGARRRVFGYDNLCLIRSGQDWADTDSTERDMYLRDVEPVLREGMVFLRDDGLPIGCLGNRYMRVVDAAGRDTDKSFGMSWWRDLAALERWAESHPTHVAIFGAAMRYLSQLGPAARLKLYHEVTVAAAQEQSFEYLHCHEATGLLRAAVGDRR